MLKRFFIFSLLAGAALAVIAGCDADPEQQRSVVTVTSINCNAPGFADVLTDSGGVADTWVLTILQNRPYDPNIITQPGDPYGDYLVTSYQVVWTPLNGAPALPTRQEALFFNIPSGDEGGAAIRLVNLTEKTNAGLLTFMGGNNGVADYLATVTFVGHEVGTTRDTSVITAITVQFADYSPDPDQSCSL